METKYNAKTGAITVTMLLSELHGMHSQGLKLWLTPGASRPYWASNASFSYDKIVATVYDFLDVVGYDSFDDDPDYEAFDESITLEVSEAR